MNEQLLFGFGAAIALLVVIVAAAVRIVKEYERGVIFRIGRVMGAKGPGLFFIIPVIDRMIKVDLRTVTMDIPTQDIITKDNVTVRVNAVTYFHVVDRFGRSSRSRTTSRAPPRWPRRRCGAFSGRPIWTSCWSIGTRSTGASRRSSTT